MAQTPMQQAAEWLDQNMHTSYPFAFSDTQPMVSESGVELPSSFIVDMHMLVDSDLAGELELSTDAVRGGFFVSGVSATGAGLTVHMSFLSGTEATEVAVTDTIPLEIPVPGGRDASLADRTFSLHAVGGHGNSLDGATGSLVVGTCSDMAGRGTLSFPAGRVPLLPSNVLLADFGLSSIVVGGTRITTDFTLRAGPGVSLSVEDTADGPQVTVGTTLAEDMPYSSVDDVVAAVLNALGGPVRMINGVRPDTSGNVRILGGDCTRVDTENDGGVVLRISNPCSRPCCGSASQEQLASALSQLEAAQQRLSEYYQALTNNVNAVQARLSSLIAAK